MTREQELVQTLAYLAQKAERLTDAVSDLDWAETTYKADHAEPVGSEKWTQNVNAMMAARSAIKAHWLILCACIREAKDTLYTEQQRKSA